MKSSIYLFALCLILFMVGQSNAIIAKPRCHKKGAISCATKCMKKVKKIPVKYCTKHFKLGKKYRKCTWKKLKALCKHKCKLGAKRCWNVCKYKKCYGKKVKVCKRKCFQKRKCCNQCQYRKLKSCWYDRLPGKIVTKCKKVWKSKKFRHCVKRCTYTTNHCSKKCAYVKIPKKYKKCVRYIKKKSSVKKICSFKKWINKCNKICQKKRYCANKCYWTTCDGKKIRKCKYKCWKGKSCKNVCCKHKQIKCYMKRVPAKYATRCKSYFTLKKVKKCYKKCFKKVKVVLIKKGIVKK
eukprot:gene2223-2397_t